MKDTVVVTAIIKNRGDKFLIVKRKENEDIHGGKWVFPGGKVSEGEDLFEALKREIMEEVGLKIIKKEKQVSSYQYKRPDGSLTKGFCFLVFVDDDKVVLCDRLEDFSWISIDDIEKYDHVEGLDEELLGVFS